MRGDLFLHKHGDDGVPQLWLRSGDGDAGDDDDDDYWESVKVGYIREDGRKLTITPIGGHPSWVGGDWGSRRVAACESILLPL